MDLDENNFEKYLRGEMGIVDDDATVDLTPTKGDSYDPFALIKRAIDSEFDSSVFETIDDSDLPLANNFMEFCIGHKYLNIRPYPKQLKFGLEFFADYCPDCSDPDIMDELFNQSMQEISERVQLLHKGKCPKCHKTRCEFVEEEKLNFYNESAGCAGQRGGKSTFVAMCAAYQLHRFLKIPNPSHYFGLLRNQALHMTFVAITYGQAEDTLWQPFRSFYDDSPWFKEYNKMLDYYGGKYGVSLYENKNTFIWYNHKKLTCYASGPDKRKLRGRTRFFSAVDELGHFHGTEKAIKLNADEVCISLERSLRTLRSAAEIRRKKFNDPNVPDALFVNVSSPSAANDKIMRLVREPTKTKYTFHIPTWEMNPNITRESLESEYMSDPIGAERDYGACPPFSDAPYISNPEVIKAVVNSSLRNACKYMTDVSQDKTGNFVIKVIKLKLNELDKNINYIIGVDTGHTKNAFAIVVQHYDIALKTAVVDMIIEVRPREHTSVHFPSMYDKVLQPIVEHANIGLVVFDKWNTINYEQELRDRGTESERYSLKSEDFGTIRGLLLSRKVIIPKPEIAFEKIVDPSQDYHQLIENRPVTHFVYQILSVRDLGRTVTKGIGVDDDIFRAWCLGVKFLYDPKWEKIFHRPASTKKASSSLGIIYGKSGGSFGMLGNKVLLNSSGNVLGMMKSKASSVYSRKK